MVRKLITVAILSCLFVTSNAQKSFEGKVKFEIKAFGEGMEQMKAYLPESYEYGFKGGDILFQLKGGIAALMVGDVLIKSKEEASYMIKHAEKTAYKIEGGDEDMVKLIPTITELDETITILGYECKKVKVVSEVAGNEITQYLWATDKIEVNTPKKKMPTAGANIFVEGLKGFPLKIMNTTMGMTMILTAVEVKKEKLSKEMFKVPAGYKIEPLDRKKMFGF